MKTNRKLAWALVGLQIVTMGIIFVTGPLLADSAVLLAVELAAIALGLWAVWSMRRSRPNITPTVHQAATLVRSGPYRWIRHPMYTAVLALCGALVLDAPSLLRAVTWLLLAATLVVKLRYEERLLAAAFPDYGEYQSGSRRLIPYLY